MRVIERLAFALCLMGHSAFAQPAQTPTADRDMQLRGVVATLPTGTSVPTGDNAPTLDFYQGRFNIQKQSLTQGMISPALLVNYRNFSNQYKLGGYPAYLNNPAMLINVFSQPGSNGSVGGLEIGVSSMGNNPFTSQDQGLEVDIRKYGQNSIWGINDAISDYSGLPPGSFAATNEFDIDGNGPDGTRSFFNAFYSHRSALYFNGRPSVLHKWAAGTKIGVTGAAFVIYGKSAGGVVSTYIPKAASGSAPDCTTGKVQPAWPTSGTVADGSCTWTYGTTQAYSIGRGIWFDSNTGDGPDLQFEWGTLFAGNAIIENAAIDTSGMTFSPATRTAAAIRLAANQPIDFSGNLTAAGQNKHTLTYNPAAGLVYAVGGTAAFNVDDKGDSVVAGNAIVHGHEISAGPAPSIAQTGGGGTTTLNATATDAKGTATEGTGATGFVVTFHAPYATAPDCVVTSPTGTVLTSYTPATATLTVVNAATTGGKFTYHCIQ
jgi:hypothetical protein